MHGIKPDASFLLETWLRSSSIVHINTNGLHVLIGEVDVVGMPNELTKNLQTCIQYMYMTLVNVVIWLAFLLFSFFYMTLENGTRGPKIDSAFG